MLAVCFALTLSGCEIIDDITNPNNPPHELSCEPTGPTHVVPLPLIDFMNDPYNLLGVAITGDVLCADVAYSGGCTNHTFSLLANNELMEGGTPELQAYLVHNSNGDLCEAMIHAKTGIDLKPLKEHLRTLTGKESGSVILHVNGTGSTHSVVYSY